MPTARWMTTVASTPAWCDRADMHVYGAELDPMNGAISTYVSLLSPMYSGQQFTCTEGGYANCTLDDHGRIYTSLV